MPDLESKIASYAFDKKDIPQRNERMEKGVRTNQDEQNTNQQGIGGLVKGWFWRK